MNIRKGLSVLVLALAPVASALADGFSDESAWRTAAGTWAQDTFDSYSDLTPLTTIPALDIDFGKLNDGIHYPTVMNITTTGGTSHSGSNVLVNRDLPQLPGFGPIILTPTTPGNLIAAVGYWNTGGDDSTEIRFYDASHTLLESLNTGTSSVVFNGIVSNVGAASVEIDMGGIGNGYITIDDLQVKTIVPEPTTLALLAASLIAAARRAGRR